MSPVWRIRGIDAHQDTPVKILHVVLLGFVKYLWRDVVQNQLKGKEREKELLATRLSSLDVSGLGISPLAGRTLVQYAGSLTGRDFRAIAQTAPFVIYDLVSHDCFETWVALSKLIPLIWQPEIPNLDDHLAVLEQEMRYFILCAARWSIRWFNKPKFHIFLHLVDHIRRFGPAIFVHSNRHAPSRDIALAFAQGNRIRHLMSSGHFIFRSQTTLSAYSHTDFDHLTGLQPSFSFRKEDWRCIGPGPQRLLAGGDTATQYLGIERQMNIKHGLCISDKKPPREFSQLRTGQMLPNCISGTSNRLFKTCDSVTLKNGDICTPNQIVVVRNQHMAGQTCVARVEEIVQIKGSVSDMACMPDAILLELVSVSNGSSIYHMPLIELTNSWLLVHYEDILCTVNAQHNCAANACDTSGFRYVYQERQRTNQTQAAVVHQRPTDLILNTAQMRDAVHVQQFRIPPQVLDEDEVITASAAQEVHARKAPELKMKRREATIVSNPREVLGR
ncbi:hypothetical protein WOLCODRAFT_91104 [Wolfiporia cocos MD-104 SS10]|uniref:Uncharacterized protein n=1 Tax=Wolfiporia cocos (strain MD-104) TaxID=742152 RepID=A0A2H3JS89_WOLCO|nr:hypothetical protein WOLCODRAFT_91104 [Wolfiporia cocos MD-104 SS10]